MIQGVVANVIHWLKKDQNLFEEPKFGEALSRMHTCGILSQAYSQSELIIVHKNKSKLRQSNIRK
jgi:hypothetical protein